MGDVDPQILAARAKLREKFGDNAGSRVGGKGSTRRKKRVAHKPAAVDDKKLQGMLKHLGLSTIPGIEEVSMLTDQNTVLHFSNPKVQAAPGANTYVISGHSETKDASQFHPAGGKIDGAMLQQLLQAAAAGGPEQAEAMTKQLQELMANKFSAGGMNDALIAATKGAKNDDDEDVPDLEEDFDAAADLD